MFLLDWRGFAGLLRVPGIDRNAAAKDRPPGISRQGSGVGEWRPILVFGGVGGCDSHPFRNKRGMDGAPRLFLAREREQWVVVHPAWVFMFHIARYVAYELQFSCD